MFDQAKAEQICGAIAEGKSARTAIAEANVNRATFYAELAENLPMQDQYARAMEKRADWHAERIEELVEKVEREGIKPDAARVSIDARKWIASKLRPKVYGDQLNVKHSGGVTFAVNVIAPTLATIAPKPALEHDADSGE